MCVIPPFFLLLYATPKKVSICVPTSIHCIRHLVRNHPSATLPCCTSTPTSLPSGGSDNAGGLKKRMPYRHFQVIYLEDDACEGAGPPWLKHGREHHHQLHQTLCLCSLHTTLYLRHSTLLQDRTIPISPFITRVIRM